MRIDATVEEIKALLQLAELDAQMEQLSPETYQSRRQAGRRRVASGLLERYEALLEAGRYPVLVAIERANCSGCHVRLPTIVEYRARRSPGIHTCPHCRRMVYAKELLSKESDSSASQKAPSRRRTPAAAGERS